MLVILTLLFLAVLAMGVFTVLSLRLQKIQQQPVRVRSDDNIITRRRS
jgi:preprotein translocase subunit YajC